MNSHEAIISTSVAASVLIDVPVRFEDPNTYYALRKAGIKVDLFNEYEANIIEVPVDWTVDPCSLEAYFIAYRGRPRFWIINRNNRVFLVPITRYQIEVDASVLDPKLVTIYVADGPNNLFEVQAVITDEILPTQAIREAKNLAELWLEQKYPDWQDPLAYWD